jgi:hypothetical protein
MTYGPTLALSLCLATVLLQGCDRGRAIGETQLTSGAAMPSATIPADVIRVPDIPIPPEGQIIREDTAIIGPDDQWNGQVVIATKYSNTQMTEYYRAEMPKLGWTETAIVRARRSAITFTRGDRIAMVRIAPTGEVDVVVAPATAPGVASGTTTLRSAAPPPSAIAPLSAPQSTPLPAPRPTRPSPTAARAPVTQR